MAVLADGWRMSSHALAIGLSAFAYAAARKYAADPSFAFGTWKRSIASYTSAIFLLGVGAAMVFGSGTAVVAATDPLRRGDVTSLLSAAWWSNLVCA